MAPSSNEVIPPYFDEAIAKVLKTTKPKLSNTTRESYQMVMVMTVLMEVSLLMQFHPRALHALDTLLDDRPPYPDMVFEAVQQARRNDLNQHTRELPTVSLQFWQMAWHQLVKGAYQLPGADLVKEVAAMRKTIWQLAVQDYSDPFLKLACKSIQNRSHPLPNDEQPRDQQDPNLENGDATQDSEGWRQESCVVDRKEEGNFREPVAASGPDILGGVPGARHIDLRDIGPKDILRQQRDEDIFLDGRYDGTRGSTPPPSNWLPVEVGLTLLFVLACNYFGT